MNLASKCRIKTHTRKELPLAIDLLLNHWFGGRAIAPYYCQDGAQDFLKIDEINWLGEGVVADLQRIRGRG